MQFIQTFSYENYRYNYYGMWMDKPHLDPINSMQCMWASAHAEDKHAWHIVIKEHAQ